MVNYDIQCQACGYVGEQRLDSSTAKDWRADCPECLEAGAVQRVFLTAPMGRVGGEGSQRQIKAFQKECRNRYYKKEIKDVRGKVGTVADEALQSADIDSIKRGENPLERT